MGTPFSGSHWVCVECGRGRSLIALILSHPLPNPQEVPVAGADRWFKLEPRSSASRVQGDCHLVLKLITTQVGSRRKPSPAPPALGLG
jgi:hypothetical protein